MIPDGKNVYGTVVAPNGLRDLLAAAERLGFWKRARVRTSGYSRQDELCLESDTADFEGYRYRGAEYFLNGAVGGLPDDIVEVMRRLSDALDLAGIGHRFEIYDSEGRLVAEMPEGIS